MPLLTLYFDLHGVLADSDVITSEYRRITIEHLVRDFGLTIEEATRRYDNALAEWERVAFSWLRRNGTPKTGRPLIQRIDEFDTYFVERLYQGLPPPKNPSLIRTRPWEYSVASKINAIYPEVPRVLKKLKEMGYVMHVASSGHTSHVKGILVGGGIIQYFGKVLGIDVVQATKHTKLFYVRMLKLTNSEPSTSILIGNSPAEIIYPPRIGLRTIHINREREVTRDLREQALLSLPDISYLPKILPNIEEAIVSEPKVSHKKRTKIKGRNRNY